MKQGIGEVQRSDEVQDPVVLVLAFNFLSVRLRVRYFVEFERNKLSRFEKKIIEWSSRFK